MIRADSEQKLMDEVLAGRLSRRAVLRRAAALGLTAPVIAGLLAACAPAEEAAPAQPAAGQTPAAAETPAAEEEDATPEAEQTPAPVGERGGGGQLNLLWWQAPTILNAHLSTGTKDFDAATVVSQPLAYVRTDGTLEARLAAEIPSLGNGVAEDGLSVTWKLRDDVYWHDGEQFTADDVVFTYEYVSNEATSATTAGTYVDVESVEALDDFTVRINFKAPNPGWFVPFVGGQGMILPEHVLRDYVGERARDAAFNLMPIGTGPFKVVDFRPGDVVYYEINQNYWDPGKPFFDRIEWKGGGDATSAARAVLQIGEADWAWNLQVQVDILRQLEQGGAGRLVVTPGTGTERIMVNHTNPRTEDPNMRSEPGFPHPFLSNLQIREALALSIERDVIAERLYGPGGEPAANNLNAPENFKHPELTWTFDLDQAAALLDEAGATDTDGDGVREYEGTPLYMLYQTTINPLRQANQEIVKAALERIGFRVELKSIDAAVFFSADVGNPDTAGKFYADLQMFTNGPASPFPLNWARRFDSRQKSSRENSWTGFNNTRYENPEMDAILDQLATELDPAEQERLFREVNWISVTDVAEIPLIHRTNVAAASNRLTGYQGSTWASDVWDIANWRAEE